MEDFVSQSFSGKSFFSWRITSLKVKALNICIMVTLLLALSESWENLFWILTLRTWWGSWRDPDKTVVPRGFLILMIIHVQSPTIHQNSHLVTPFSLLLQLQMLVVACFLMHLSRQISGFEVFLVTSVL